MNAKIKKYGFIGVLLLVFFTSVGVDIYQYFEPQTVFSQLYNNAKKEYNPIDSCQGNVRHLLEPLVKTVTNKDELLKSLKQEGYSVYGSDKKQKFGNRKITADWVYTASIDLYKNTFSKWVTSIFPISRVLPPLAIFIDPGAELRLILYFKGNAVVGYNAVYFCNFLEL